MPRVLTVCNKLVSGVSAEYLSFIYLLAFQHMNIVQTNEVIVDMLKVWASYTTAL